MDTSLIGREDVNLTRMLQGFEIVFKQILKLPDIRWALLCIPPIPQDLYDKPYPKKIPHFNYFFEHILKSWGENLLLKDYGIKIVRPNARYEIQKYGVDLDSIESLFNNTLTEQVPGVIFGFVPGIFLGLKAYYEKHRSVPKIHKNSMVISFGGWSAPDRRKIEPENFREKVSSFLKLDPKNIRDIYCFTETDPIFAECEFHNKHIPPWVDVIVRNVETLEPVADGQKGLTNVINPMAYSYAGVSLLQDDVVKIETMDSCPCGREGKIIKVYGPAN